MININNHSSIITDEMAYMGVSKVDSSISSVPEEGDEMTMEEVIKNFLIASFRLKTENGEFDFECEF